MINDTGLTTKQIEIYNKIFKSFTRGDYDPRIIYSSSEDMREIESNSIQLIVTSPPYNVGKTMVFTMIQNPKMNTLIILTQSGWNVNEFYVKGAD